MRYDGQYINVKRMGLALEGLIRREYPGDFLQFIEMYTFAKPRRVGRNREADAQAGDDLRSVRAAAGRHERPETSARFNIPPHFTNIQHALQLARQYLVAARHAEPADHPHHRRPADGPLRRAANCSCSTRPTAAPKKPRCAKGNCASAKASRSTSSCCQAGPIARRHALRLPPGRIDQRPRVLHRRQGSGPLRRLGLSESPAIDRGMIRLVIWRGNPIPTVCHSI